MQMPLIELKKVTKSYKLGGAVVEALRGIDLKVEESEFAAIWGPSGSGKSTLLNLIGLLDHPSSGELFLSGRSIERMPDDELAEIRNRSIGFVFQNFNLIPVLNAIENVMLPLQIRGVETVAARTKALRRLDEVGLADLTSRLPDQMSGGQRQRVAIARALVIDPLIVLADEPTANLDSETGSQVVKLMREINQHSGVTFLFATHDPRLMDKSLRHISLQDGRIADWNTDYVLTQNRISQHP